MSLHVLVTSLYTIFCDCTNSRIKYHNLLYLYLLEATCNYFIQFLFLSLQELLSLTVRCCYKNEISAEYWSLHACFDNFPSYLLIMKDRKMQLEGKSQFQKPHYIVKLVLKTWLLLLLLFWIDCIHTFFNPLTHFTLYFSHFVLIQFECSLSPADMHPY